jgi:hypothetical protein
MTRSSERVRVRKTIHMMKECETTSERVKEQERRRIRAVKNKTETERERQCIQIKRKKMTDSVRGKQEQRSCRRVERERVKLKKQVIRMQAVRIKVSER